MARVFVLGASGSIGRSAVRSLLAQGHAVTALLRPGPAVEAMQQQLAGATLRLGDVRDATSLERQGLAGERFDAVLSCLASRTGAPADAWAIDHRAHSQALPILQAQGVRHWVQLSALCVQRPELAFQQAKLAFEAELMASGLSWSIVRPTAFFKSLSGQVARVQAGKPFLVFGDGRLTACKPISDRDLADYLATCVTDPMRARRILPIGGPGPALTPLDQAHQLGELLGRPVRVKQVPLKLLDAIVALLSAAGRVSPRAAAKAELARIGRHYATHSMLCWDAAAQRYDADATPETGHDTWRAHAAALLAGTARHEAGEHAVFDRQRLANNRHKTSP
jgi:divinyl chlorophyllide a 8-vinyl-reductase